MLVFSYSIEKLCPTSLSCFIEGSPPGLCPACCLSYEMRLKCMKISTPRFHPGVEISLSIHLISAMTSLIFISFLASSFITNILPCDIAFFLPLFPSSRGRAAVAVGAVAVGFSCPVGQKGQVFWKNYFSNQKAFLISFLKRKHFFLKYLPKLP